MDENNFTRLKGNITRDPKVTSFTNGASKISFSIAVNREYKKGKEQEVVKEVSFFEIEYWKPSEAEIASLKKGKLVKLEGRLQQDRWEKDGKQFSAVKVVANSLEVFSFAPRENSEKSPEALKAEQEASDLF